MGDAERGAGAKRSRAHHVLPQFYLRAWADEDGLIAMLNREGKEVRTGSKALAVETDFYAVKLPDGEKDSSVETALAEVDGQGSEVHRDFLEGRYPPSPEQKRSFALWLGLQSIRGRAARASGAELTDKMQKMMIRFGLQNAEIDEAHPGEPFEEEELPEPPPGAGPGVKIPDYSDLSKAERKELASSFEEVRFEMPRAAELLMMLRAMPDASEPFLDSEWHLLRFEEPRLWTSDEPIILQRALRSENRFLGLAPGSADQIYAPLSPTLCLAMIRRGRSGTETIRELPPSEAELLNRRSLANLWTQLFRSPEGPAFPAQVPPLPAERITIEGGPQ